MEFIIGSAAEQQFKEYKSLDRNPANHLCVCGAEIVNVVMAVKETGTGETAEFFCSELCAHEWNGVDHQLAVSQ